MAPNRKIFESEAAALVHDHYVATKLQTRCSCGALWQHSELYEVWTHPTKTATTGMKQLRSTTKYDPSMPLQVVTLADRQIPICYSCAGFRRPATDSGFAPLSWDQWSATLKRKAADARSEAAAARPAAQKVEPKLEDL